MTSRTKVYELAKELGVDSQHLVDVVQRLGIDVKNSMSVLGTEEVRTIREHYRKSRAVSSKPSPSAKSSGLVTEKRVGATVIRRRAAAKPAAEPSPAEEASVSKAAEEESMEAVSVPETQSESDMESVSAPVARDQEEVTIEEENSVIAREVQPRASQPPTPEPSEEVPPSETHKKKENRVPVRRAFPSIIKKVATEEYLGEKIGPKVEKKEKPKEVARPKTAAPAQRGQPGAPGAAGSAATGTDLGPRRVKEVEFAATETGREAGRRKLLERQNTVFKSSDYLKRELVHATKKRKNVINRPAMKTRITKPAEHKRVVEMDNSITVAELAKGLAVKVPAVIAKLMNLGVMATANQSLDLDTTTLVAQEFGYEVRQRVVKEEDFIPAVDVTPENLKSRAPVVTIMGHVDHGKTSLLDNIRKSKVAAGEAGGITQHVGAYTVNIPKGKIAFIDTPGHEAFTSMRARGAKVTDIVVLVVSAVDGVMPQTLESVSHAQAANVPIIVAVNKMDLPDANPDRVKQTLAGHNLNPEEWGGDTIYVNVSAKTGMGIDQLLESILLQAELLELKANYACPARGAVVESRLDRFKGPVAWILVQHGILRTGDMLVCGTASGKIRALTDSAGRRIQEAGPSDPVEVLGLSEVPVVGDMATVLEDEKKAPELVSMRQLARQRAAESKPKMTLEEMMGATEGGDKELRVILKADVQGSAEALRDALLKFPTEKVKLKLLYVGSGGVTESDVMLAKASKAVILGFNIRPDVKCQKVAEQEKVEIRTYNIIYDLLDEVKKLLEGMLDKVVKEKVIGRAEVRDIFTVPKVGTIAGSAVIDGKVTRGCFLRLLRDSRVIYEGKIASLKRFKEDVREVAQGFECGIALENFNDLKRGDQFEAFIKEESQGTL